MMYQGGFFSAYRRISADFPRIFDPLRSVQISGESGPICRGVSGVSAALKKGGVGPRCEGGDEGGRAARARAPEAQSASRGVWGHAPPIKC